MASSEILFNSSSTDQYILLHLSDEIMDKTLYIKPSSDNATVLCTDHTTYQIKDVQQSNSLMFLAKTGMGHDLMIKGEAASWLETTLIKSPRISLKHIPVYDGSGSKVGVPEDVLFASIPASRNEIEQCLAEHLCLQLEDGFVKLDPSYVMQLLRTIVSSVVADGLELSRATLQAVLRATKDETEDEGVLTFLYTRFSLPIEDEESGTSSDHETFRRFDGIEIVRYTGIATLELFAQGPVSTTKFLALWVQSTPVQYQSFCKDLTILTGHYIQPVSTQIQHFEVSRLPLDAKQRVHHLLSIKDRWLESDMSPYLEEIASDPKAIQSIILKHARKTKVGKTTFIEARGR